MTADGMIDCSQGFIEVAGIAFNDPHATKTNVYSRSDGGVEQRSRDKNGNVAWQEKFYLYAQKFGFGQPTAFELPPKRADFFARRKLERR
jgi:cell division protein FtsI/penicillin-binding protein 2